MPEPEILDHPMPRAVGTVLAHALDGANVVDDLGAPTAGDYGDPVAEYWNLVNGVTLWDVGLERQTQIRGPDAKRFVDYLCCRDMSKMQVGDCRYTILTDEQGLIMSDPVTLFVDSDTIWLSHGNVDLTLWARGLSVNSQWRVEVCEPDVAPADRKSGV